MANRIRRPLAERFWPKVDKDGPLPAAWSLARDSGPCWIWTAARNPEGYGRIGRGGRGTGSAPAHSVAYELLVGPIPTGLQLDHLCRVPACVNPAHLEPVTHKENGLRGINPPAENARKSHCLRGHPYDAANTYVSPPGYRQCRACKRLYDAKRRARNRQ